MGTGNEQNQSSFPKSPHSLTNPSVYPSGSLSWVYETKNTTENKAVLHGRPDAVGCPWIYSDLLVADRGVPVGGSPNVSFDDCVQKEG